MRRAAAFWVCCNGLGQNRIVFFVIVQESTMKLRIMPRFHAVNKSLTATDRPIQGQSFTGMKRSSVLPRLILR